MINDMHKLLAASPGSPACECALVAYMIIHTNIHVEIARSAGEREKGHGHTLPGPGRGLPSPDRIRGGWEDVSMKSTRSDPRASVTFD